MNIDITKLFLKYSPSESYVACGSPPTLHTIHDKDVVQRLALFLKILLAEEPDCSLEELRQQPTDTIDKAWGCYTINTKFIQLSGGVTLYRDLGS